MSAQTTPAPAFDFGRAARGVSQEQKCGLSQEQSQEQNPFCNSRASQEQKCRFRILERAGEDAVRRALGFAWDGASVVCPLPGHEGTAWLESNARPGHEFVCDCLGRTAEWGDDGKKSRVRSTVSRRTRLSFQWISLYQTRNHCAAILNIFMPRAGTAPHRETQLTLSS